MNLCYSFLREKCFNFLLWGWRMSLRRGGGSVGRSTYYCESRRAWVQISLTQVKIKIWAWLCMPVTPALGSRDRNPGSSQAGQPSLRERICLKGMRQRWIETDHFRGLCACLQGGKGERERERENKNERKVDFYTLMHVLWLAWQCVTRS